ncbi:hypothetical protein [Roseibium sp.]|uniref:hypothetical protein n=1 Tax=Roseibium sp. TaxID=1936156 RepID=UPI003A970A1B
MSQYNSVDPMPIHAKDVDQLLRYLGKTRDKATSIRDNAPAGSYLDGVLERTIHGLDQEIAHLRYHLTNRDAADSPKARSSRRMRPAQ